MSALNTEYIEQFAKRFKALTGNAPFPWQESLFSLFASGTFPASVNLPTGTGKTSIMALWLLGLAAKMSVDERQIAVPKRLIWVVNRRVVVDQATSEAEQLRQRLNDTAIVELEPIRCALRKLSATSSDELLGISTLRGQFEDNAEWRSDPARPAVIVGTVDMIGSRLLFSGYGIGFKTKPLHAGFLGQDSLLVHDEAHLEPAFQELLTAIREEQKRCKEFGEFRIMALSATSRGVGEAFGLTQAERYPPEEIPDPPEKPIHVIWRRQKATKTIRLHEIKDEGDLAKEVTELALKRFGDSGCAVLVFLQRVEDVEKVRARLPKEQTQQLTGTMRGLERDMLVTDNPIFRRFLFGADLGTSTVYLVCTSAGEVGVNMSADHLVCDLATFDSMVQRFGRVNRFGNRDDTEINIFFPAKFEGKKEVDDRRKKTLGLIRRLEGSGCPRELGELDLEECLAAFSPAPTILPTSDILFDSWALTTIKGKLPGRPPVEPYLHGLNRDPPETHVAWRDEVGLVTGELLKQYKPEDLLDDYPLKPHELLRDRSDRVLKHLAKLAVRHPEAPVWLLADSGSVEVFTLGSLTQKARKDRINYTTLILPPSGGGIHAGLLDGDSDTANDVADEWRDKNATPRRIRVWDDDPQFKEKVKGMRLIRTIDINPGRGEDEDEYGMVSRCYWHWFELPKSADNDGSKIGATPVLWKTHTDDVVRNVSQTIQRLPLSDEIRKAVVIAARFHDLGKRRALFQRIIGNMDGKTLLAKSGKKKQLHSLNESYRHEFVSLLDTQDESDFRSLDGDMQELVLHLIAAHHGRGRPHFPSDEAFDPEPNGRNVALAAATVPQRFVRLQGKYGRWGLAYLESLLRSADYAASANPSEEEGA